MTDIEMLNYVLDRGILDGRTLDAFTDMASKLASGLAKSLKPKQREWVLKEHGKIGAMAAAAPARAGKKDKEFGRADKPCEVINCGQLPLFPPGVVGNAPRHGHR